MPNSQGSSSVTDSVRVTGVLTGPLHIPGYRFKSETTASLAHGESVDICMGFRIASKSPIVAKVSTDSSCFEREFYIMKKLYHYKGGSSHIVRPLEYINMPSGLTVAIYADEGLNYLRQEVYDPVLKSSSGGSDGASTISSASSGSSLQSRVRNMQSKLCDTFQGNGCSNAPTYDLCTFLRFAIKCTDCLEFTHRHNIVHGELRLSAFQWDGNYESPVKMWNFGSGTKSLETYLTSKRWRKAAGSKEYTHMLQDLLIYMSPEQTGRTTYVPDHRTDIYSLGVVFFVLLTGRAPFNGGLLDILNGILSRRVPLVHELQFDVPEILSRIVEKMLHKVPDDRYTSARGIRADLTECLNRLSMENESPTEVIPPFPLAEHDVASVFTLPKTVYGRQDVIFEMKVILERAASLYESAHLRNRSEIPLSLNKQCNIYDSDVHAISFDDTADAYNNYTNDSTEMNLSPSSKFVNNLSDKDDTSSISTKMADAVSITGTSIVGLYGPGGAGKSTLYNTVQSTARKNGLMARAKFDSRNKVPYATVLQCLSQILQQVLSESQEEINQFYDHFKMSLGTQFSNIILLTDFVPELSTFLRSDDILVTSTHNDETNSIEKAKVRFQKVFVEAFRAITLWRMTSLFLDDLHQADDPSLELIEALVVERVKILVFLSYRDQEVSAKFVKLLENKNASVHFIKIEPLSMESVVNFIGDTLHRPHNVDSRKELIPLADAIFRKTRGNAFYTAQLLQTLERKKLIYFDWEKNRWDYDMREIEEATIYGANDESQLDVSFMVARLRELPRAGQSLLKWASFVGDTFSWKMIKTLMIQIRSEEDDNTVIGDGAEVDSKCRQSLPALDKDNSDDECETTSTISMQMSSTKKLSSKSSDCDPVSGLQAVLQEGYIMPVDGDEFKWCHDRISQAAAELADPETRDKIHLTIAQYLMQEKNADVFLIADHLLRCENLLVTMDDKQSYRQLMIEAGAKGKSSGASSMAFEYCRLAIELGDPDTQWSDEFYSVTLNLYSNAVALSWVIGNIEMTEILLDTLFKNTTKPIDRVSAYLIKAQYDFGRQMHEQGRETMLKCLDELGNEQAGMDISDEALERDYAEVEEMVLRMGADEILKLDACDDPILNAAMTVMDELLAISYFNGRKSEWYYWSMRILHISFTRGPTSVTGNACTIAACGYANVYKKYKFGERLASLGILIAEKYSNNQDKGRTYSLYPVFVRQWNHHYADGATLDYFKTGLQYSLAAGDRLFTAFSLMHISIVKFVYGYHTTDSLQQSLSAYEDIHSWSPTIDHNTFLMCMIRSTKAFRGETYYNTPYVFDGDDGFNDEHYLSECAKYSSNFEIVLNWYESFKIIPLTLYGHLDTAIEVGYRCVKTLYHHPLQRFTRVMLYYFSLALLEKARHDPDVRESCLRQVKENQEMLYEWAINSRINYMMFWTLIEAELVEFSNSPDILKACRLYDDSINLAREGSWYFDLSVMHEYTGAFYLRVGLKNNAYGYIAKAMDLYKCHGSYGKVAHIQSKYTDLLSAFEDSRQEFYEQGVQTDPIPIGGETKWSSSSASSLSQEDGMLEKSFTHEGDMITRITTEQALMTLDILDMASILKSSQVLSSEVKFEGLLKSMMNIILENSAADCGAIVIKDEKYGVCAFGSQQQESTTTYDPPRPLSEDDELVSSRIINHTIHTGESVLIHDVEQDTRFTIGPWFERSKNKSVICMPIIHKITIVGCLLIEGPVGIFTQRHITVLSLLCQQMGISITNAFLFKSVQRVTMANMRMIEMQKQALEEARRSKAAADRATRLREVFLANMSHEIRTPFSGFYGMVSLLAETKLDSEQRDMVQTAKQSCEMLLQLIDDLLNFSKLRAGKVSLDLSPVVIDDTIADVVEILIAMAIQKRVNITYTIDSDVPSVIITDANRLRQVITNLVGNAIKFTPSGEITIRCSLDKEKQSQLGNSSVLLRIEVIDSGIGISEEQRKMLFVPFSQVDGSTTRKYGGTGLGLSICRQLVELMSGEIEVSSTPGQGSNFYFSIQATRDPEEDDKKGKLIYELLESVKKTRILVADKHASTVTMVQKLLPGVKVDGVTTVKELLLHQATDYPVIIIGLFLTHDPDFEEWAHHLCLLLERAQCIVVMHYPTGAVGELLDKNQLIVDIENDGIEIDHNYTMAPCRVMLNNKSKSVSVHSSSRRAIVRMAVPLRQIPLLRTLVEMLRQTAPAPATPSTPRPAMLTRHSTERGVASNKLFTVDELALLSTMNILIAEDNVIAQKLLYKQLTRLGIKVVCANDGLEALDAWTHHPPQYFNMAFFDHHMPKCDGVEATKRIRTMEKSKKTGDHFTIVTLSADIQDCAREKCLNAGMDGYFTKPMNQKTLAEVLKRYCLN
ncbi:hypothetical protein BJV82DRAFT_647609 [Fennellomyces sp. T-0311]|nr:hypothetical protein BJV82DRAFT_647609 [Fennellomyces sp. T-0311]